MCAMENLRIWEDESTGGILGMIHFSAHFRPGYLTFWLNDSSNPIRVKDDGGRYIKIKGLRVTAEKPSKGGTATAAAALHRGSVSAGANGALSPGLGGQSPAGAGAEATAIEPPTPHLTPKEQAKKDKANRIITGARIEFATEAEKVQFLAMVKEVQRTMTALPEL